MFIIGIDDSGRGPLIGPMILAGVLVTKEQEEILKKNNVKDSKVLAHSTRKRLAKIIKKNVLDYKVLITHPLEIDESLSSGVNLNELEAKRSAEIINFLNKGDKEIKAIIDCPSPNKIHWQGVLKKYLTDSKNLKLSCEHKADANHVSASAASILAKVTREEEISILKKKYGDFGSGYPSDPKTISFLKEKGKELRNSGLFRKSWSTWKKLFPIDKQSIL
jgi:ribonuclease HII